MRCVAFVAAAACGLFGMMAPAVARVAIRVDLASQTMAVSSASGDYVWPISSARDGYRTPRGTFGVQRMEAMHRSHKYHNSPMPHSLFFTGGYAIHGTYEIAALGAPASHGCIRLAPGNAAALYQMVRAEGGSITITGSAPEGASRVARREQGRRYAGATRRSYGEQRYGYDETDSDGFGRYEDPYAQPLAYAPQRAPGFYLGMGDAYGY